MSLNPDVCKHTNNNDFGRSLKKLHWEMICPDEKIVAMLSQKLDISDILAKLLVSRNIHTIEEANNFLNPKLKNILPDPFLLKDMDKAVERIIKAIDKNEKITIFADYDVDGATSTAVLCRFFESIGIETDFYIPSRLNEGYGPNVMAFQKIKDNGTDVLITVDCGIVAFEQIAFAKKIGMDVIVVDHHIAASTIPDAIAVINPNRIDDDFPYKSIAAVAVAFLFVIAIRTKLRENGWFTSEVKEPDLLSLLDLVCLGTICDVMPLKHINRAFVTQGLHIISSRQNLGLAALFDIGKIEAKPQAHHLSYLLGPRINAGGRVSEGGLGAFLLITKDKDKAKDAAERLDKFNQERRALEVMALEEAIHQIKCNNLMNNPVIFVTGLNWHIGVIGILASRIKEKYNKPVAVVSLSKGFGKGSMRSIEGIDLGHLIAKAKSLDLILEGGGHAMAGGFTIKEEKISAFQDFLISGIDLKSASFKRAATLYIDAILSSKSVNRDLMTIIERAAPFGYGNPQPRFAICDVTVVKAIIVGMVHILMIVKDKFSSLPIKCMLFRGVESEHGQYILQQHGFNKRINIVGTIQPNMLNTNQVEFIIEDISINE